MRLYKSSHENKVYLIEIVLFLFCINYINFTFFGNDPGFIKSFFHPYWIVIFLISANYGFYPGLVSGVLASINLTYFIFEGIPNKTELEKVAETGALKLPISFILVALFLGTVRQRYIEHEKKDKDTIKKLALANNKIKKDLDIEKKALNILESRIVGETATFNTLYNAAKKLETFKIESIYDGCLEILNKYFKVEKAALYIREKDILVLRAALGLNNNSAEKFPSSGSIMESVMRDNKVFSLADTKSFPVTDDILAAFPLRNNDGNPIGAVAIIKMDFLFFNRAQIKMIELVIDWTSRSLYNKSLYDSAADKILKSEELDIYKYRYFQQFFSGEFIKAKKYKRKLTLSLLKISKFESFDKTMQKLILMSLGALFKTFLKDTHMVFHYKYKGYFAVISPFINAKETQTAMERLAEELHKLTNNITTLSYYCTENAPETETPEDMISLSQSNIGTPE